MTELQEKIYNGKILTEEELRESSLECDIVTTEYGENRRWSRSARTIIKINDKLFCIEWDQGLTEYQEDHFGEQPYEVEEIENVVVVKNYVMKKL